MRRSSVYSPSLIRPTRLAVLVSLLAGLVVFLLLRLAEQPEVERLTQDRRLAVLNTAVTLRSRLEGQLNLTLQLTRGMTSLIAARGWLSDDDFRRVSIDLSRNLPHVRNVAIAHGTVIRQVYPLQGNESTLGVDYRTVPGQWPEIQRVIKERRDVLVGPVDLIQGGQALIQRTPIYALDDNGEPVGEFLGLVAMVISMDELFAEVGLNAEGLPVALALRRLEPVDGGPHRHLFGRPDIFTDNPVVVDVLLPGARWQLGAIPREGWDVSPPGKTLLSILVVMAAALAALGAYLGTNFLTLRADAVARLAESERRLREAQRLAGMGAWEWQSATNEFYWSGEVYRILGCPQDGRQLTLNDYLDRIHPDDRPMVMTEIDSALGGGKELLIEHRAIRASDRREIWVQVHGGIQQAGEGPPGTLLRGVIADITARRDQETERQAMVERLQRSNDELEQFAYVASHNLQEPLRMIGSYLQLLQRRYKGKLDRDADEFIQYAVEGALRMRSQIIDLLAFARLHSEGKPPAPTDTLHLVQESLAILQPRITETAAVVDVGDLPVVLADGGQLEAVFVNLLSNALKYSRPDTAPKVSVSATQDGRWWQFRVRDNGIGVAGDDHERVFRIFHRLNLPGQADGTGIGLAFCRRIIERHGGQIWMESGGLDGAGTTVAFTLPAVLAADPVPLPVPLPLPESGQGVAPTE